MSTPLLAAPGTLIGSRKSSREILALGRGRGLGEDGYPGFGTRAKQATFYVLGTQWETKQELSSKSPPLAEGKEALWYIRSWVRGLVLPCRTAGTLS